MSHKLSTYTMHYLMGVGNEFLIMVCCGQNCLCPPHHCCCMVYKATPPIKDITKCDTIYRMLGSFELLVPLLVPLLLYGLQSHPPIKDITKCDTFYRMLGSC